MRTNELAARFWPKVQRGDGCWLWVGAKRAKGYGCMSYQGKQQGAHRLSWMVHHGEIPAGLFVLHHCDNPPCVNPKHLFLGTNTDNQRDSARKGRTPRGEGKVNARLTEENVRTIRSDYAAGTSQGVLARRYGVHWNTVVDAINRRTWKYVA